MQKPRDLPATVEDNRTYDCLFRIAYLCANCWGVKRDEIETADAAGERQHLARMAAIAIARDLLLTRLDRLALYFGGDSETSTAACNRIAERIEQDYDFRLTIRFLKSACATVLGLD